MIPGAVRPLVDRLRARTQFPEAGTPIDCAVSGGADSSALLVLASDAGCQVTAHHVDHGLRAGSAGEARVVEDLATRFGANFVSHRAVVEPGSNLEARARQARFALLPESVATGHTLDDRAETIVLNMLRGSGRRGLSPHTDRARHPIIGLRRSETVELARALDLRIVEDPSNRDLTHRRNRVRHEVLPLLSRVADRDISVVLDRQADVMAEEDSLLDALAGELDATDAKAVAAAHPALAQRAIRNWIESSWGRGYPPDARSVQRVLEVARGASVSTEIDGGQRVHRRAQRLRLEPRSVM